MPARPPASAARPRVCALVVTYNRVGLLLDALDALDAQTRRPDAVLVLDNASTDDTSARLAERQAAPASSASRPGDSPEADSPPGAVEVVRSETNTGAAGGVARGLAEVAARGPWDWVWVMDDDVRPAPDALARLLAAAPAALADTVALTPVKVGDDGHVQTMHAGRYAIARMRHRPHAWPLDPATPVEVGYVSFVGVLVRGAVAARVVPRADFFLVHDDLEWALRLAREGRLYLVPGAVVEHRDTAASPDLAVVRGRRVRTRGYWRAYYSLRNRLLLHHAHARGLARALGHLTALRLLARGLANSAARYGPPHRARRNALLVRGYLDGLAGRSGKTVDPADYA